MKHTRRGAAVAMIVLLLAAVQMVVIGGLAGSVDETDQGVRRVLMVRSQYAADGAGLIVCRQVQRGLIVPVTGATWQIGTATASVVSAPPALTSGDVLIDVRTDSARRRLRIVLDTTGP